MADNPTPPPTPEPAKIKVTHAVGVVAGWLLTSLVTYVMTKTPPVAPTPVVVAAPVQTPSPPVITPLPPPDGPKTPTPALTPPRFCDAASNPAPSVIRVDTLRIEAAKIELIGNVNVTVPEIKVPALPTFTVEVGIPKDVQAALTKPTPEPVVNVHIDAAVIRAATPATVLPDVEPTKPTELTPAPKPVRVWPKSKEDK